MIRRWRNIGLGTLLAGGFYLLLIDTVSLPELYVIPAVLLLAAGSLALATRTGHRGYRLPLRWMLAAWRPVVWVPRDLVLVSLELAAQLAHPRSRRGVLRTIPVPSPAGEEATTTKAAVSEMLGSLAPNTIVIGHDPESGTLLVHQLRPRGSRESLDPLGGA